MTTANRATRAGAAVVALGVTLLLGVALAGAQPAAAGGADWIVPARDRYEVGQTVVMIGYGNAGDWRAAGPFHAYLRVDPAAAEAAAADAIIHPTDLRVGTVVVEEVTPPDLAPWWTHRVSITFDLPADLPPASYTVLVCNDPCTASLGWFWPEQVNVGVDPPYPVVRNWPLTEPMIRWLEDGALIMTPWGREVTAADVRAGRVQAPPPPPAPATVTAVPAVEPDAPSGADVTASRASAGTEPAGGAARTRAAGDDPGRAEPTDAASRTPAGADDAPAGGKAAAWWIAGEVVLLVAGCATWRYWSGRRRRRALRPVADEPIAGPGGDGQPPDGGPGGERLTSVGGLVYEPDPDPDSLDGPRREPVRIRL
jgi:hypothetical protein